MSMKIAGIKVGICLYVGIYPQIWNIYILILLFKNSSNVVHSAEPFLTISVKEDLLHFHGYLDVCKPVD